MRKRVAPRNAVRMGIVICTGLFLWNVGCTMSRWWLNASLFAAIKKNDARAVQDLLAKGADANAQDYSDSRFQPGNAIINWLDHRASRSYAPTPLTVALESQRSGPYLYECLPENTELVKALLDRGAHIYATEPGEEAPLELAAGSSKDATVRLMLEHKGRPISAQELRTALLAAVVLAKPSTVDLLLEHGADPNTRDSSGWSVLMRACLRAQPVMVESLVRKGADIHVTTPDGRDARALALEDRQFDIARIILTSVHR